MDEHDTGFSRTDNLTNRRIVTIAGTTEPNATVALVGSVVGDYKTTRSDDAGYYKLDITLQEGDNQFTPIIYDKALNSKKLESIKYLDSNSDSTRIKSVYTKDYWRKNNWQQR